MLAAVLMPAPAAAAHTYVWNKQNDRLTYLRETGAPIVETYTVAPTTRFNIDTNAIAGLEEAAFGALIEVTNDVTIVVERSLYWDANGFQFSGGANATGIRLTP